MVKTTIQYASDLHLDNFPYITTDDFERFLVPSAPILVLAGDIASAWHPIYSKFLAWVSRRWQHVILITGNHEYHCEPTPLGAKLRQGTAGASSSTFRLEEPTRPYSRLETDKHITAICWKHRNLHFLQKGATFYLPKTNLVFIGTTLYSAIDPKIHNEIRHKSDFRNSYTEDKSTGPVHLRFSTPQDFVTLHAQHKQALGDAIRSVPSRRGFKVIVVTHYMPTEELLEPQYKQEAWRSCYASKDDDIIRPPVSLWICGHSHRQVLYKTRNGIQMAMNARGYNKPHELERMVDKYSPYGRVSLNYV